MVSFIESLSESINTAEREMTSREPDRQTDMAALNIPCSPSLFSCPPVDCNACISVPMCERVEMGKTIYGACLGVVLCSSWGVRGMRAHSVIYIRPADASDHIKTLRRVCVCLIYEIHILPRRESVC